MSITTLEPKNLWGFFHELCQVPRPSKKEEQVIAYLQAFAKRFGLDAETDAAGNVLIRKAASTGYENHPIVILQSHMDMVCEKNNDTVHNFDTDPIQPFIDGEWVKAKGTTLGADNGIGMAAQLAVLADNTLEHPALECLFTVDEETGLTGADALDPNLLKGKTLINLDSEDDGEFFIGCAGGIDTTAYLPYLLEQTPAGAFFFKVSVKGLKGGHSGDDIDKGLGNANKILTRFLWNINKRTQLHIASIDGGNLRNAIAREAMCIACVPLAYKEELRVEINHFIHNIEGELSLIEPNLRIELESSEATDRVMDRASTTTLLNALYACPHGVIRMSFDMEGLVETSTNLASIKMVEPNEVLITTSQRSSIESAKYDIAHMVESTLLLAGARVTHGDGYPGWKPNPSSPIAQKTAATYETLFGKKAKIRAIHAGLECGLFLEKYPTLDMVSVGPTMRGVHSPDERLHIGDTQKFWKLLVALLKQL